MSCECNEGADLLRPFRWLWSRLTPRYHDIDDDGWLDDVEKVPARYAGGELSPFRIQSIVLHRGVTGGDIASYFHRAPDGRKVSAHFVVYSDGTVKQCVSLSRVAWHAGKSWNHASIGIEHQGPIDSLYSEAQAKASLELIEYLLERFPRIGNIVSHRSIAPKRRRDPGPYPWDQLRHLPVKIRE